ncbi:MAG: DNA recombination protein RmuC [Stellaceae bacterium]
MPIEALPPLTLAFAVAGVALALAIFVRLRRVESSSRAQGFETTITKMEQGLRDELARGRQESATGSKLLREEVIGAFAALADNLRKAMADLSAGQGVQLDGFGNRLNEAKSEAAANARGLREEVQQTLRLLGDRLAVAVAELSRASETQQEALRRTVEGRLDVLRSENTQKLEQMRQTVDEKLQGTLEQRLGASFKLVNDSLAKVHESVGEMQVLATGVGDLKRILSNVKSRGTWGEVALGNILEEILSTDQYARNVEVRPHSGQRVEYAVRLPGDGQAPVWLPVDAKYPTEDYDRLVEATERGEVEAAETALRGIESRVRGAAKEICAKYVAPPHSTEFAVMFLPTEGLFAEVVRRPGLVDALQRDFHVMVAGPTTLVSLLTSLRMGFRSLAIQQRSSEVWKVLSAVKTEFEKFGGILDKVQKKLDEAQRVIADAGVRRRAVDKKLLSVETMPEAEAAVLLELAPVALIEEAREAAE